MSRVDLDSLAKEFAGFDPAAIIHSHKGNLASVWFEDKEGHAQAVDMPPADALKFYEAGLTVFLPDVTSPTIERWHDELVRSLDRPPRNFLTSLFLSKNGNISGCHFDHIENFTVQLCGTKTWRIMENRHAPLPTVNYSAHTARPYLEELWLYGEKPLPPRVADEAELVTVTPGSLLYIPRGYWHEVEAAADSISLLLGFPAWTWLDVLLPSLRTMLLRRREWRESAVYPRNGKSWQAAHRRLGQLCRELADLLKEFDPAEFLPQPDDRLNPTAAVNEAFLRNRLCTLGIYPADGDHVDLVASVHQGELSRTREARVPAAWKPVLETVDRGVQLTHAALADRHAELDEDLSRVLEVLVALEVIRPAPTDTSGIA